MPMDSESIEQELLAFAVSLESSRPSTSLSPGGMHRCGNTCGEWRIETSWPTS
jgi:hypothetical protein